MIDSLLNFVATEFNAFRVSRTGSQLGKVSPGVIVDDQGRWVSPVDELRVLLFQIEEEPTLHGPLPLRPLVGNRDLVLPPPLRLNLVLLFAGRFQQYQTALQTLSLLLTFFHVRPVFSPSDSPGLPSGVDRVTMELLSWTPEQLSHMWAAIGAKQLPSAVYRMRMVALDDTEPTGTGQ
jgi:hypothetical protein